MYLRHAGCHVPHAFDGCEGVLVARAHRPALVLMDIRMPRVDGIAAPLPGRRPRNGGFPWRR